MSELLIKTDPLIPAVCVVTDIRDETPDVKTFRVEGKTGGKVFAHMPGQCAMLSVPGVGEAMFSITSSPTIADYMEVSVKRAGAFTEHLHGLDVGSQITIRGPYGNAFPVDTELSGKDLLFIAGGIGLAPLRSVIQYVLHNRVDYGRVDIVYGSRSMEDLVALDEIKNEWSKAADTGVHLTIDREQGGWGGHVGFVPDYVKELFAGGAGGGAGAGGTGGAVNASGADGAGGETGAAGISGAGGAGGVNGAIGADGAIDADSAGGGADRVAIDTGRTVLVCGPPIMIKFTLAALRSMGFSDDHIYTTMELRMKCGIGKCGRCNIGSKYVCKDGPVFRCDELGELPDEY